MTPPPPPPTRRAGGVATTGTRRASYRRRRRAGSGVLALAWTPAWGGGVQDETGRGVEPRRVVWRLSWEGVGARWGGELLLQLLLSVALAAAGAACSARHPHPPVHLPPRCMPVPPRVARHRRGCARTPASLVAAVSAASADVSPSPRRRCLERLRRSMNGHPKGARRMELEKYIRGGGGRKGEGRRGETGRHGSMRHACQRAHPPAHLTRPSRLRRSLDHSKPTPEDPPPVVSVAWSDRRADRGDWGEAEAGYGVTPPLPSDRPCSPCLSPLSPLSDGRCRGRVVAATAAAAAEAAAASAPLPADPRVTLGCLASSLPHPLHGRRAPPTAIVMAGPGALLAQDPRVRRCLVWRPPSPAARPPVGVCTPHHDGGGNDAEWEPESGRRGAGRERAWRASAGVALAPAAAARPQHLSPYEQSRWVRAAGW